MFDELDDPAFAGADPGARAAVAARAAAIRRRRHAAWAGCVTSLVLVMAGIAYGMRPASAPRELAVVDQSPSPSGTAEETAPVTPAPDPTTASPTTPPPPVRHPTPQRPPTASATTTSPTPSWTVHTDSEEDLYPPDGNPGWSQGFEACEDLDRLPGTEPAPFAGVSLRLDLPSATLAGGKEYRAWLVVSNDGTEDVRFDVSMPGYHDTSAMDAAGHGSAVMRSEMTSGQAVELAPGEEKAFRVRVVTWSCGDTRRSPFVPLPPGTYSMTAGFVWTVRAGGGEPRSNWWHAPRQSVTITE